MSPVAGIADSDVIRPLAPEEIDGAGELVSRLGSHNKGDELIQMVAASKPQEVTNAGSRPEDQFRTLFLDAEELEQLTRKTFDHLDIEEVIYGRVHGRGTSDARKAVVVLFLTASGRTSRGVLPYTDFERSIASFDEAVSSGKFNPHVSYAQENRGELRKELAKAESEVAKLRGQIDHIHAQAEEEISQAGGLEAVSDEELQAVLAKLSAEASGRGLAPVGTGRTQQSPEVAAQEAAAQAEAATKAAEPRKRPEAPAEPDAGDGGEPEAEEPELLSERQISNALGKGDAKAVAKRIAAGDYSEAQLDQLATAEQGGKGRKTVADAISAARG